MTARQVYEAMLVELNKTEAPSLLLEDFNYFFNKAISQYINLHYNIYDTSQQTTDDLRVLKATAVLKPVKVQDQDDKYGVKNTNSLYSNIWEVELPEDYLHILNCICEYKVMKRFKCYNAGESWAQPASRLTSDMWSQVINNFYMRPSYRNPYYFIHNVNPVREDEGYSSVQVPTNPYQKAEEGQSNLGTGTDPDVERKFFDKTTNIPIPEEDLNTIEDENKIERIEPTGLSRILHTLESTEREDQVEHYPTIRYGNPSQVRMEIRYGKDDGIFKLDKVYVDYLKTPQHIRLTQEQIDLTEDTSQILEFPDYVCQEIINGLVRLVMENSSDQRLQTHMGINTTVATPGQQQESK